MITAMDRDAFIANAWEVGDLNMKGTYRIYKG
jgi:hypothetical protein